MLTGTLVLLLSVVSTGNIASQQMQPDWAGHEVFEAACGNGLQVVVDSRPGTRTVFAQVGVRVGSRDEPLDRAGISHLLEHLLFKEGHTPGASRNPAFSALRAAGALVNASTDFELTEYHADLPADRFAEGWDALVALVMTTVFDDEDVKTERDVVLQEVALGKTDPLAIVAYSVLGRMFPDDPIGQPVIGFRKTLKKITTDDLLEYYRRHYVPANMYVVIAGAVDTEAASRRVCGSLGAVPHGTPRGDYARPQAHTERLYRFRTLTDQAYLMMGALTGGESSPDAPALALLSAVLGDGRTSRLHRRLVEEEALTREVLAISFQVSNAGAFGTGAAVAPDRTEQTRAVLLEEVERLATEPITRVELDTVVRLLTGRLALRFETNSGAARFHGRRLLYGRPVGRVAYVSELTTLTPEDLTAVARRYWGDGPIAIEVLPARGLGKVFAALKFLLFRRL